MTTATMSGEIILPALPYSRTALAPHISEETIDYHYGKHHAGYVTKVNTLLEGSPLAGHSLDELIRTAPEGALLNNASQVFNHTFYWNSLSPSGGGDPSGALSGLIRTSFGGIAEFRKEFSNAAAGLFGSGWVWLAQDLDGILRIVPTANARCPVRDGLKPLLTIDVWEHAYYIDYRNARPKYVDAFFEIVNWDFAAKNLK